MYCALHSTRKRPFSLAVSAQDLFLVLLCVAVGRGVFAALAPTEVTEVFLLAVGGEVVFDDISAAAVRTSNDFGNDMLTLTHYLVIPAWHTTVLEIAEVNYTWSLPVGYT